MLTHFHEQCHFIMVIAIALALEWSYSLYSFILSANMTHISFDGGARLCTAGSGTGERGQLLCGQETSHVVRVVQRRKAPSAIGGLTDMS